jgi:RHH-type transcriptional regulator, rel operon repressor / antitoxin RelB
MLSIRLDPETERRLAALAKSTGRTKSYYARELIESNLEDLEDRYVAEARLEKRRPLVSLKQARKELGLDQ